MDRSNNAGARRWLTAEWASDRAHRSTGIQVTSTMQRAIIFLGLVIVAIGLAWPWLAKLQIGRLPGDLVVDRPGLKFFFPLTTMIIVSVVLSVLLWLFRR
jgi:Protein of unknown function (DUF2905)